MVKIQIVNVKGTMISSIDLRAKSRGELSHLLAELEGIKQKVLKKWQDWTD